MRISTSARLRHPRAAIAAASLSAFAVLGAILVLAGSSAASTPTAVPLGTAGSFAVLAGAGVHAAAPASAIHGDVGVSLSTGASITGLSCAEVTGKIYTTDAAGPLPCRTTDPALLTTAQADQTLAYGNAALRLPDTVYATADNQLGGKTLVPGVYRFGHATTANLSGPLTLNGNANSVWIFQATSDLVFASSAHVTFSGGAQACNVFWQVTSSATLDTGANVSGTILALTSATVQSAATLNGRVLVQTGAVTLDGNTITRPACAAGGGGGGTTTTPAGSGPARALYCAPDGQSYNLVVGEDKLPPYDTLNLVPAYVDPVTGSVSCNFPQAVTTTTAATTTTAPPPPVTTTTSAAGPPKAPKPKSGVRAAKVVRSAHVTPKPARHQAGFTG